MRKTAPLHRATWRRTSPPPASEVPDLGPVRLETVAQVFATRTESVLGHGLAVSYGEPTRAIEPALLPSDRVWRCEFEGIPVWCAIDAHAQRAVLEWILNGPGAPIQTVAERTIVSECVDRLLATTVEHRWCESIGDIAWPHDVWHGTIDVSGGAISASIRLYTVAEAARVAAPTLALDDVPIDLDAQLRPFAMSLGDLLCWEPGTTVRLGDSVDAIPAMLRVAGGPVLFGALGSAQSCRAIRLSGSAACS